MILHLPVGFALRRHQMETLSVLLAICAGNSLVTGEFPSQRPVTWSFDVFFDLGLNKNSRKIIAATGEENFDRLVQVCSISSGDFLLRYFYFGGSYRWVTARKM